MRQATGIYMPSCMEPGRGYNLVYVQYREYDWDLSGVQARES